MKHPIFHLLGCLIPIALIFILPALGVSSGVTFTVFIVLMFACHLFMMGGHSHGDHAHNDESNESKKGGKSCH
jgi:hypothetical protein